ncbi:MAG TPA: hypothetical protein VGM06_19540 [Polyangiaceae bacterium]|jgi:hypothetical protein
MASKIYDAGAPSLYPDHSTLCDAFRSSKRDGGGADPSYRPLKTWLERFARGANLCLSVHHLTELARWRDRETANTMAQWYDELPIVWAKSTQTIEQEESDHWTKVAAGVPSAGVRPFSSTLMGAFHVLTPEATATLLGRQDQAFALLDLARNIGHLKQERFIAHTAEWFRADLSWADENGLSFDKRREREAENEARALRELARESDQRLTERRDTAYARRSCSRGQVQDLLVELFHDEPKAMPYFRVQRCLWPGFRSRAQRQRPGSKNEHDALSGALEDHLHASVGAAYCDLFTCDGDIAEWLAGIRPILGRRPQMTARKHVGGSEGFVWDLMATWSP